MTIHKHLMIIAIFLIMFSFPAKTAQAGQMNKKQIAKKWQKLKGDWSGKDMKAALGISKRDSAVFNALVELKKKNIAWGALKHTVDICEGRPKWMKEFWKYVTKYNFHPREVYSVFKFFPPSETHRFFYFYYRAGGGEGMAQKTADKKDSKKLKGYPKEEVMGIFKRARFDIKLIKKYFEKRKAGIPVQKAWAKIEEEVKAQIADEKKKEREKQKARMKRQKELAEKKRRLDEYQEKQKKAKEDEDDKKENVKTVTAADLFGSDEDE